MMHGVRFASFKNNTFLLGLSLVLKKCETTGGVNNKIRADILSKDDMIVYYNKHKLWRAFGHNFPFIAIRKVPREVLKTEGKARYSTLQNHVTLRILIKCKKKSFIAVIPIF